MWEANLESEFFLQLPTLKSRWDPHYLMMSDVEISSHGILDILKGSRSWNTSAWPCREKSDIWDVPAWRLIIWTRPHKMHCLLQRNADWPVMDKFLWHISEHSGKNLCVFFSIYSLWMLVSKLSLTWVHVYFWKGNPHFRSLINNSIRNIGSMPRVCQELGWDTFRWVLCNNCKIYTQNGMTACGWGG